MPASRAAAHGLILLLTACGVSRKQDVIFLPSASDVVERMLALARVGPDDVVYDLGCGDGRIAIAAARSRGARAVCVDIDPALVARSRASADTAGVAERIRFQAADLFEVDLGAATVVTLYLSPAINARLRPKLFRELRPGTRIISHNFDMGDWRSDTLVRISWPAGTTSTVHLWVLPADVAGTWELAAAVGEAERRYRVRFAQQYQRVVGTASLAGQTIRLTEARLEADTLLFTLADTLGGRSTAWRFRGRVAGARMDGTFLVEADSAGGTWEAVRP